MTQRTQTVIDVQWNCGDLQLAPGPLLDARRGGDCDRDGAGVDIGAEPRGTWGRSHGALPDCACGD